MPSGNASLTKIKILICKIAFKKAIALSLLMLLLIIEKRSLRETLRIAIRSSNGIMAAQTVQVQ